MYARLSAVSRSSIAGGTSLLLVTAALAILAPAARADSAPMDPATPVTMAADGLPTVQINGVAWAQVVVGNTVYVAGQFSSARPAGAAAGTQETPRNNMLAYDIRTGELVTSFVPDLNGQALAIAASPDGQRIYVAGDFTTANGQPRKRVAAYDTATGALVSTFQPAVSGQVRAVAATNSVVYLGGLITAVGSTSRTSLAAVSAADGSLLPWAPVAGAAAGTTGSNEVDALVVTNGGSQVVAGGRFAALNGTAATGVGALDATTGATKPFAVNAILTNQGTNSGVWGLSTDGTTVYGSAWDYSGPGNLEGTFAATADGGSLQFVAYCRGDNYSSAATNGALYIASHMHDCHYVGGYPDSGVFKRATAFGLVATGKVPSDAWRNKNWVGQPTSSLLDWFPTVTQGTFTGQNQGGWSVAASGKYLAYGGEFPKINGVAQQGLVRFAMPDVAPNKIGPDPALLTPAATALSAGAVRITWKATNDQDNENLTYRLYRDGNTTTPFYQVTRPSTWWNMPAMSVGDTGLSAGSHQYRVTATDPMGNVARSAWTTVTVTAGGSPRPYADAVRADGAIDHWSFGERSGSTGYDLDGVTDMTLASGVGNGVAGALVGDSDTAFSFNGTSSGYASTTTAVTGPQTFTVEGWFQTSSRSGGRIVGFGNAKSGTSSNYDRLVYLDTKGRLNFGVYPGTMRVVTSTASYNDGRWHHVAASLGSGGMALYADGKLVGSTSDVTSAQAFSGYWRVGADSTWSGSASFNGRIDEVAVYPSVLSAAQVASHVTVGQTGKTANVPPTADFTSATSELTASFDATGSTDVDGSITGFAWDFGDGTTGAGQTVSHIYAGSGTFAVTLTVTDDVGATARKSGSVTVTAPPPNVAPTAAFALSGTGRSVSVDASASGDPDGSIVKYAWDFGDGTTATGVRASHDYTGDGTYAITLSVTDNRGATTSAQRQTTVALLAADAFARTVSGGLGTADVGGDWTVSAGGVRQSVVPGTATFAMTKGTNTGSYLAGVAQTSADVRTTFSLSAVPTGGGAMVYVSARRVGVNQEYRARLRVMADGTMALGLVRLSGTSDDTLIGSEVTVPGLVYTPGTALNLRVQASGTGTTALSATVWAAGAAEPVSPTLSRTDTTAALQAPGQIGLTGYLSGSATASVDLRFTAFSAGAVVG